MPREPVRIRIAPRESIDETANARTAFWRSVPLDPKSDEDISTSEGKLCREFGTALRQLLIAELSAPLRSIEDALVRSEFGNLDRLMFRFFEFPRSEKDLDRAQILDSFTRLLEQRQQFLRDQPGVQRTLAKIAAAGAVYFSVRIAGYSSLNLDLSAGAFKNLAEAFDNDFDSFRVFLEAFVPQAFGEVFSSEAADKMSFTVQVPTPYEKEFVPTPSTNSATPADTAAPVSSPPVTTNRERAEWLWRLANGSLLVPLLLALFVMYEGMSMLKDIHASQAEAMKPILEFQLKLLEEDRHRLFKEAGPASAPAQAASSVAPR